MHKFTDYLWLMLMMAIPGTLNLALLRFALKSWWRRQPIRFIMLLLMVVGCVAAPLLYVLERFGDSLVAENFGSFLVVILWVQVAVFLTLICSGLLLLINWISDRKTQHRQMQVSDHSFNSYRRQFLSRTAATIPFIAATASVSGTTIAFYPARVYRRVFTFNNLPANLAGLRILHLSDLHMWDFLTPHDLQIVLDKAKTFSPDLVVVTGDIADDPTLLPVALQMITDFNAPLGSIATLGNHDHALKRKEVFPCFVDSPVQLLVNENVTIKIGQQTLVIGGIDDPNGRNADLSVQEHYQNSVKLATTDCPPNAFCILLSHRPNVLNYVEGTDVSLILAGHTHGGQIGLAGHSILELFGSHKYPWGLYRRGNTQLYTTSGTGQWFPFRLGCRPEAGIIELQPA